MLLAINLDGGQTDAALSLLPLGALFTGSGMLRPNAFTASEQLTPGMAIDISGSADGDLAIIKTADGSTYAVKNTTTAPVTIAANSSGVTKTDAIVLYIDLAGGDPDNAGSPGAAHIISVRRAGISTGEPTDGEIDAATLNNPWEKIYLARVEHGTGEIEADDLTDVRRRCNFHTQFFGQNHIPETALQAITSAKFTPTQATLRASTNYTPTNTVTLVPGLTVTLNPTVPSKLHVRGVFDVDGNGTAVANDLVLGYLYVDGVAQSKGVIIKRLLSNQDRATVSMDWDITLSPGSHTIELRAQNTATRASISDHSCMTYALRAQ